jgi:hypothetical protein
MIIVFIIVGLSPLSRQQIQLRAHFVLIFSFFAVGVGVYPCFWVVVYFLFRLFGSWLGGESDWMQKVGLEGWG